MYDSIVLVQHNITSKLISYYNTNTGKILCIAPDDLFDLWSLFFLMSHVSLTLGPDHKKMTFFWLLKKEANFR